MSNRKCCVPGCVNKLNLHKFPNPDKDKELFNTWVYAIGGDILNLQNTHIYKHRRVCHTHFEDKYWCRNNRIINHGVPTLNMPGLSLIKFNTASRVLRPLQISEPSTSKEPPQQLQIHCSFVDVQMKENVGTMREMNEEGDVNDGGVPPAKKQKVEDTRPASDNVTAPTGTNPENTESADKYRDFVNPEEVEKLKEFRVLDEVKSNDEESHDSDSDTSSGESAELPEEEIEKMLEEDLPDGFKAAPKPKEKPYVTREKIILEEKGINHFEVLPLDWIMIRHQSGIPVYVHRASRVCTVSKPYFLGKGNAKKHDIPISAIPCLSYRRALEEEERQKLLEEKEGDTNKETDKPNTSGTDKDQANNSSGTANTKPQQGKCPYKQGLIKSDVKVCPVSKVKVGNDSNSANPSQDVQMVDTTMGGSEKSDIDTPGIVEDGVKSVNVKLCPVKVKGDDSNSATSQDVPMVDTTGGSEKSGGTVVTPGSVEDGVKSVNESGDGVKKSVTSIVPEDTDKVAFPVKRQPIVLPGGIVMQSPRVETVSTSWRTQHLTHEQVHEYCKRLFKFRILNIMHFNCWADRRKYTKARKALQYPMLPEGTKLITIPVQSTSGQEPAGGAGKPTKRDWVMNMNGRSYLSVFHEYARRALQKQPVYEFKQLENASTPYQATVFIGGMQYGVGRGSSKRQAKSAAARASIHILIPEMRDHLEPDNDAEPDFVFFDYVGIEDPRIAEFCAATCEPTPHAILRTCLLRNFGAGDRHIHTEMKKLEYQKIELTMKVGKHSATVVCKNKKTAKQRASQAILQALHPHVRSWGSLLRLYGSRSVKSCKEKKLEEQQITLLQDKARHNEPNYAVLDKLRAEMRKLRERDEAVVPIGTLLLTHDLPTHSGSNLNNVEL